MPSTSWSERARERVERFANALTDRQWLVIFFCALVAAKVVWVSSADGPVVFGDEYFFKSLAQSFVSLQPFVVDGKNTFFFGPAYSLVLTPALLFGNAWYRAMLVINALVSSTLIFPVAWIARQLLSRAQSWVCVWLVALIPFQVVFPRLLMTENLFLTLFVASIGFMLADLGSLTRRKSLLVGAVWGVTYLTRFIFLPIIPVLAVLWWFQPAIAGTGRVWADAQRRLKSMGWTALGVCAFVVPWYGLKYLADATSGRVAAAAVGSKGIAELWITRTLTTWNGALVIWLVLYLAYLVLMSGPFLPALTLLPLTIRRLSPRGRFFAAVCMGVTGALVLVSVNYMATLNRDLSGAFIEGRYVLPLLPLLAILAFVALQPAGQIFARVKRAWLLLDLGIVGLLASVAYYVDILRGVWPLPPWFSNLPWVSPDTTGFSEMTLGQLGIGFFGFGLVLMAAGFAWVAWRPRQWLWAVAVAATLFYVADSAYTGEQMAIAQEQSRPGKILADLSARSSQLRPVLVALDASVPIDPQTLASSITFWDLPANSVIVSPAEALNTQLAQKPGFVLTQTEYPNPLSHYVVDGKTYWVYEWPLHLPELPLVIENFGPTETVAGQGFNIQPNGDSAMWLMADNPSAELVLVFGEKELPTVAGAGNVVAAAIPPKLLAQPGVIQVRLLDPITRRTSNVVQFTITDH